MLLIGGRNNNGAIHRDMYIFHLGNNLFVLMSDDHRWELLEKKGELFPTLREAHRAVKMGDNSLFIAGGYVAGYVEPFYFLDLRML